MDGMMEKGGTEPAGLSERPQEAGGDKSAGGPPPRRFSAKRKRAVGRLLRGEPLELLARELNVTAARLSQWRDRASLAAEAALKERTGRDEITRLKGKVGEMTMETELLREKIARLEAAAPLARRRSRRCRAVSPSVDRVYGLVRVARCRNVSRATVYRHRRAPAGPKHRPGPVGPGDDATLLRHIRQAIAESRFTGEGYRKIWARLRFAGIRSSPGRVRRLMRENGLLAPHRVRKRPDKAQHHHRGRGRRVGHRHEPDRHPGRGRRPRLRRRRPLQQRIGIHAANSADRFQALEPVRQGVRQHFGAIGKDVAAGLKLRRDHGSNYMSDDFQDEIAFLGIDASPSFVRQPEGDGVAERLIRTLKENLLWVRSFETIEEPRPAPLEFTDCYNTHWLVARHRHRTPAQVRVDQQSIIDLAA